MADGKGCQCGAYGAYECGCPDADWTPQEVYDLRAENEALRFRLDYIRANRSDGVAVDCALEASDEQIKLMMEEDEDGLLDARRKRLEREGKKEGE